METTSSPAFGFSDLSRSSEGRLHLSSAIANVDEFKQDQRAIKQSSKQNQLRASRKEDILIPSPLIARDSTKEGTSTTLAKTPTTATTSTTATKTLTTTTPNKTTAVSNDDQDIQSQQLTTRYPTPTRKSATSTKTATASRAYVTKKSTTTTTTATTGRTFPSAVATTISLNRALVAMATPLATKAAKPEASNAATAPKLGVDDQLGGGGGGGGAGAPGASGAAADPDISWLRGWLVSEEERQTSLPKHLQEGQFKNIEDKWQVLSF